jgi:tetratricopeptide (TPR) repeat protein
MKSLKENPRPEAQAAVNAADEEFTRREQKRAGGKRVRLVAVVGLVVLLTIVVAGVVAWRSEDPERVWNEARRAFEARQFGATEALLKKLARLRSPTPLDWMLRAQVAVAHNQPEEALADLEHVPDSNGMGPQARLQEGQLELRRWRAAAAERKFLHALELDPTLMQARRELIYIYGIQLRRSDIGKQFPPLADKTRLTFDQVYTWCLIRGVVWEPHEAAGDLAKYVLADPTDRASRLALAQNYRVLHWQDDAKEALAPLPDSDPDARALRVMIALDESDFDTAEKLLQGGIGDHADLARLRGRLALMRNHPETALAEFRKADAADPDRGDTCFYLAQSLQMLGHEDEAKPFFDKARKLERLEQLMKKAASREARKDPHMAHELGAACAAAGRFPEARAWYQVAITRDPMDQEAQKALSKLGQEPGAVH